MGYIAKQTEGERGGGNIGCSEDVTQDYIRIWTTITGHFHEKHCGGS